jgi:acyl-coenzyme A synthetase/AMP-(fatty) acid ligase
MADVSRPANGRLRELTSTVAVLGGFGSSSETEPAPQVEGVKEAAVVGVPDMLGEAILAYVVRDDEIAAAESEITRICRELVEGFAVPHELTFIDELPKTASGKVRRRSLPR